jgi:hypothetical protein
LRADAKARLFAPSPAAAFLPPNPLIQIKASAPPQDQKCSQGNGPDAVDCNTFRETEYVGP